MPGPAGVALLKDVPSFKNMNEDEIMQQKSKLSAEQLVEIDLKHNAAVYACLPMVAARGEGTFLYDHDGKRYYDMIGCFGAANQGYAHPRITAAVKEQMKCATLTSRGMYSDMLSLYTKFATELLGYDQLMPANSGNEAAECAVKLARRWGHDKKGITDCEAKIIMCEGNFWGRSISAVSSSISPAAYKGYGPYTPGFIVIPFNNIPKLKEVLEKDGKTIAAFMVEPIQGEAGCRVPADGYLKSAKELCEKHNVLFVADEVQTGLGRTGKMFCCDHDGIRPDIMILGKALSGGVSPVSAILADEPIMSAITRGTHGSTFGGNNLGCAAAIAALAVVRDEKLADNAERVGKVWREEMTKIQARCPWIIDVRGRGLMSAIEVAKGKVDTWQITLELLKVGVLAKPTHGVNIRFTPPLVMTEAQMRDAMQLVGKVFDEYTAKIAN